MAPRTRGRDISFPEILIERDSDSDMSSSAEEDGDEVESDAEEESERESLEEKNEPATPSTKITRKPITISLKKVCKVNHLTILFSRPSWHDPFCVGCLDIRFWFECAVLTKCVENPYPCLFRCVRNLAMKRASGVPPISIAQWSPVSCAKCLVSHVESPPFATYSCWCMFVLFEYLQICLCLNLSVLFSPCNVLRLMIMLLWWWVLASLPFYISIFIFGNWRTYYNYLSAPSGCREWGCPSIIQEHS